MKTTGFLGVLASIDFSVVTVLANHLSKGREKRRQERTLQNEVELLIVSCIESRKVKDSSFDELLKVTVCSPILCGFVLLVSGSLCCRLFSQ